MIQNKKYFCYELYKNISVVSNKNKVSYSPCSIYNGFIAETDSFDITTVWDGPAHQHLKKCIESDVPIAGCQACYEAERNGAKSRRLSVKENYELYRQQPDVDNTGPVSIDYSVGNLCNLKCVICGPTQSIAWVADYRSLNPDKPYTEFLSKKNGQIEVSDPTLLGSLQQIHFHGGGEPLMSDYHVNLLQKVADAKTLTDVRIFYNTNGTCKVNQNVLDLWGKCQLVELYYSIDDIAHRFEYQRTGAQWQTVVENIQWFKAAMPPAHLFYVNCVYSFLNIYYLDELVDWLDANFSKNRLGDKVELIFQKCFNKHTDIMLTTTMKSVLMDKFQNYPTLISLVQSIPVDDNQAKIKINNFINYVTRLDGIRGTSYQNSHSEWYNVLTGNL